MAGDAGEEAKAAPAEDKPEEKTEENKADTTKIDEEQLERKRVGEGRLSGLITEVKGHMAWIQPLSKILHPQAKRHWGLVYLAQKDIAETKNLKEGGIVDFLVYEDSDGLGAEDCKMRSVLRLTLAHREARTLLKDSPQWSEYLSDSEHYPSFEREHGVLLRKYAWPLPFVLVELWGQAEAIPKAAIALGSKGAEGDDCHLRLLVSEDDLKKVDGLPEGLRSDLKVSEAAVLNRPLACRSVTVEAKRDKCAEVVEAFLKAMTPAEATTEKAA